MLFKNLTLSFLLLLPTALLAQTWEQVSTGLTVELTNVHFTSASNGYVLGNDGSFHHTTDGGQTWTEITHPMPANNYVGGLFVWPSAGGDIILLSGNENTITGDNATLLRSTDGGANWTTQDIGHTQGFENFITCSSANNCHLIGGQTNVGGMVATTKTGGPTWTKNTMGDVAFFGHGAFPSANVGYAVGLEGNFFTSGIVYKTSDGGDSWQHMATLGSNGLFSVHCFDNDHCMVGDGVGTAWETTDGGATWNLVTTGASGLLIDVGFVDDDMGYFLTTSDVLKTTDGGATWASDPGWSGTESLNSLQVLGHLGVAFMVGENGSLYKATFTANNTPEQSRFGGVDVWPTPAAGIVNVRSESAIQHIRLSSLAGQTVMQSGVSGLQTAVDISALPSGVYLLEVETAAGTAQHKLVRTGQ